MSYQRNVQIEISEETWLCMCKMFLKSDGNSALIFIKNSFATMIQEKYKEFCDKENNPPNQVPENICLSED